MAARSNDNNTKEKLLKAAEQLFATKGYTRTTVLDITREAGCNVAAVNYHFHGKSQLYQEVVRRQARRTRTRAMDRIDGLFARHPGGVTIRLLLEEFVAACFEPFLTMPGGRQTGGLLLREWYDPHAPPEMLLRDVMLPLKQTMVEALVRVCPSLGPEQAGFCIDSVFAQANHLIQAQIIFAALDKQQSVLLDLERFTAHIVRFSVGGIRDYLGGESERAEPKP